MTNVGQVIELAKEWIEGQSSQISGFCGAHLMGNINHLPKDSSFPAYKDVDMDYEISIQTDDPAFAPAMFGFGINIGSGHLNFSGHQRYAQALFNALTKEKMHETH